MERIQQKIERIYEYITYIKEFEKENCEKQFLINPTYRGALLHYLYLMSDACISLGEIIIKHYNLRSPQSYGETFEILSENKIIDKEFAYNFSKIAGFRNFLAHDYEKIDAFEICNNLLKMIIDVENYLEQIKDKI